MSGLDSTTSQPARPEPAPSKSERELRRAVSRLSRCAIEDIEAIWSQLDPREQAQLRPLLAEASGSLAGSTLGALPAAAAHVRDEATPALLPPELGNFLLHLPETVAASVLASFKPAARETALRSLPDPARRDNLRTAAAPLHLRPAARRALQAAALAAAHDTAPADAPAPVAAAPRGLARLWRRSARA